MDEEEDLRERVEATKNKMFGARDPRIKPRYPTSSQELERMREEEASRWWIDEHI